MQNSVKKMLRQMFRDKKRQKRIVAVICALSVLVATGVFNELMQPVITMTPDPVCGVAEHAHISECYQNQLVCGVEESEEHAHGDGCYESVLACGKSEHKHADSCYPEEIKEQPVVTAEPATVSEEAPEVTTDPEPTEVPEVTTDPETTEVPEVTADPEPTEVPEVTAEPESTEVPEVTVEPESTAEPEPTAEPTAPAITGATASAETAFVGQTVTWNFAAEGASELTYSIDDSEGNSVASGALDAGATHVSWLADRAGMFTLTVTAANEFGSAAVTGSVIVDAAAELTAAVRSDSASAYAGESATFHFAVSGGVEPTTVSITVEQDGEILAALDTMTDSVTVEPQHMGDKVTTLTATITAADSLGATVSDSVQIPVAVRIHETESDWIKATETELTDDWRENLIAVAKTQLGYEESKLDFVIDEEGNAQGYTRYGQWWGASHDEWCAMFASFCLNYAEIPENDFPREANCEKWIDALNSRGLYAAADEVEPEAGDLIFFDWENDGKCDHVGIVTDADTETIATIEGNSAASVRTCEYEADDECIIGFGLLTKAFERHLADEFDLDLETGVGAQALVLEDAILRAEPAADSMELAALTAETVVTVTAAEQNLAEVWYEITFADLTGYLPAATLELNYIAEEELVEVEPEVETPSVEITSARETNAEGVELVTFTAALTGLTETDYIWQWQIAETTEGPWTDIEGATGLTYTAELTDAVLASYYRIHGAYIALPEEESALMTLSMDEVSETETADAEITPAESTDNDVYSDAYAVEMPVVLTGEGADYTVTVTYGSDANIPAEATLSVREIEPGAEEYDEYYASMMEVLYPEQMAAVAAYAEEQAVAAMAIAEDEPATVTDECCEPAIPEVPTPTFLRLFDICIMMDGVEIEPAAEVDVNIEFHSGITSPETDELSIIHFHEDEAPEMVEGHREGGSVDFKADRFSTYGVATLSLSGNTLTADSSFTSSTSHVIVAEYNGSYYALTWPDSGSTVSYTDISSCVNSDGSIDYTKLKALSNYDNLLWYYSKSGSSNYLYAGTSNSGSRLRYSNSSLSTSSSNGSSFSYSSSGETLSTSSSSSWWGSTTYYLTITVSGSSATASMSDDEDDAATISIYSIGSSSSGDDDSSSDNSSYPLSVENYVNNTGNVTKFYWRFEDEVGYNQQGSNNVTGVSSEDYDSVNDLNSVVTVTYTNAAESNKTVPYTYYTNRENSSLTCATVVNGADSTDDDTSFTINITTKVGYVITSYRIACEDKLHSGEHCMTLTNRPDQVFTPSTSGLYQSNLSIDYTAAAFGHNSNNPPPEGDKPINYVLILTIAEVNVNLKVDKSADKESVSAGSDVGYTVDATTTNDLAYVQFSDAFFKTAKNFKVYYYSGDTYSESDALEQNDSNSGWSYYTTESDGSITAIEPSNYYVDTTNGILYIDGLWTSDYKITITYDYTTDSTISEATTITNTVVVTGNKTETSDTVQDLGVAQVKVIVNKADKGSMRVYKTFNGLTLEEVVGSTDGTKAGVLAGYSINIKSSDGSTDVTLSTSAGTLIYSNIDTANKRYQYYGDLVDLDAGTYTVTETGYTVKDYSFSATYTITIGEEDGATTTSGSGTSASASVEQGKTTFVHLYNNYSNAITVVKVEKVWQGGAPSTDLPITINGVKDSTTLEYDAILNAGNSWTYVFGLDNGTESNWPSDATSYTWTVSEDLTDGYYQVSCVLDASDTSYTDTWTEEREVTDSEGNKTTETVQQSKTYPCVTYVLTNAKYGTLDIEKVDANNTSTSLNAVFDLCVGTSTATVQSADELVWYVDSNGNNVYVNGNDITIGTLSDYNFKPGNYSLTEVTAPAGYYLQSESIYFQVTAEGAIVMTDSTGEALEDDEATTDVDESTTGDNWSLSGDTLTITNHTGTVLPNTGGPGKYIYTISGLFFMAASLLYGIGQRRKRERGEEI